MIGEPLSIILGKGKYFNITSEQQPYLGFSWIYSQRERKGLLHVHCTPFRPIIRLVHIYEAASSHDTAPAWEGISATIFLNNHIDMKKAYETANKHAKIIWSDVCKSKLVANDKNRYEFQRRT